MTNPQTITIVLPSCDPDHPDDIVRRVREVLELIWKDRAEAIEKEACEILGVKEQRDYFRKPGKGGFWDDHVSRYSKSRRKAPIYWLLQSSKKNHALWLYYHRLDKDILSFWREWANRPALFRKVGTQAENRHSCFVRVPFRKIRPVLPLVIRRLKTVPSTAGLLCEQAVS